MGVAQEGRSQRGVLWGRGIGGSFCARWDPFRRGGGRQGREMVEEMRRRRDSEGADIIVAIGTLGTPPTDAPH
jgi:hypothetical protein